MPMPFIFKFKRERRPDGFTLIELLIVVAIIAILAAIAVPNFIEAQVRAKVSRCKADMRSLATAIESYAVDYNNYPNIDPTTITPPQNFRLSTEFSRQSLERLSTPVSYITVAKLDDPFAVSNQATRFFGYVNCRVVQYGTEPGSTPDLLTAFAATGGNAGVPAPGSPDGDEIFAHFRDRGFLLQSVGPDETNYAQSSAASPVNQGFGRAYWYLGKESDGVGWNLLYDPTNGTTSVGDIVRTAGGVLN